MFIGVTPSRGVNFERRTTAGGNSTRTAGTGSAPLWVKLQRSGTVLSGYHSADGVSWTLVKTLDVPMSYSVHAGLAVSSHRPGVLCEAVFA